MQTCGENIDIAERDETWERRMAAAAGRSRAAWDLKILTIESSTDGGTVKFAVFPNDERVGRTGGEVLHYSDVHRRLANLNAFFSGAPYE